MKKHILILLLGCVVGLQAQTWQYWWDSDIAHRQQVATLSGNYLLDATDLTDGMHTLSVQVMDSLGQPASIRTAHVLKLSSAPSFARIDKVQFWFNNDLSHRQVYDYTGDVIEVDVASLSNGMHTLCAQLIDEQGHAAQIYTKTFLKLGHLSPNQQASSLSYWFDDDIEHRQVVNQIGETIEMDVSALVNGMHTVYAQLIHTDGSVGAIRTHHFLVLHTPNSERRQITHVRYWFNDQTANATVVPISTPSEEWTWTSYISTPSIGVRSSNFLFTIENGQPILYARNSLQVLTMDNAGASTYGSRDYTDYRNSRMVSRIDSLRERQSSGTLAKDSIRWYYVDAEEGDSLQIYTSTPATIQIFAPSAQEIYRVSEYASTQVKSGCHTFENGRHYVAVHDIAGNKASVTVNFRHINKYEILKQNVKTFGNGGFTTVTYQGNGLHLLESVDLVKGGDTVRSVFVGRENISSSTVIYDGEAASEGTYNAIFHFEGEDRRYAQHIKIEPASTIKLSGVIYENEGSIRLGSSAHYNVSLGNSGNMTAYRVPVYFNISAYGGNSVTHIKLEGLDLPGLLSEVDMSGFSEEDKQWAEEFERKHYDLHLFSGSVSYDPQRQDSIYNYNGYFLIDIPPHTSKNIIVSVLSSKPLTMSMTYPREMDPIRSNMQQATRAVMARTAPNNFRSMYCCIADNISCLAGITSDVVSMLSDVIPTMEMQIADCAVSAVSDISSITQDALCGGDDGNGLGFTQALKKSAFSVGSTIIGCASNFLPTSKLKKMCEQVNEVLSNPFVKSAKLMTDVVGCLTKAPKPECYDGRTVYGQLRKIRSSLDPNDIYGYQSEAGSRYMTADVESIHYTIEFENDTALATAAAQTIVVVDTLDGSKFDLASFRPTRIKIGSHSEDIDEEGTCFVRTIDMRPAIQAIAEIKCDYDAATGIARWTFSSLDPLTMETVEDIEQGILPINHDGTSGIGEVEFEIRLRQTFAEGTTISNQANIFFDANAPILTPVWTNTIDATRPHSQIDNIAQQSDSTLVMTISGTDNLSGIWKYEIYGRREGDSNLQLIGECMADSLFICPQESDIVEYQSLAIDSAGNREAHELYELRLLTNDADMGYVTGAGLYQAGEQVTIEAVAESGYGFSHWSDYETTNPRNIWINGDTELTAYFVPSTATAVESTHNTNDAVKYIENEQLYIRCAGHVYSTLGRCVE